MSSAHTAATRNARSTLTGPMYYLRLLCRTLPLALLLIPSLALSAQNTVPAVLLSDVHFDPFHNPRDLPQLLSAPVEKWPAILNASTSLVEDAERAAMQARCHALSYDTTWPLLKSTLAAAAAAEPRPVFVTLSGDLLAHEFQCRFHHLNTAGTDEQLSAFAAKTVAFVSYELRQTFPHTPVYVALGNNDSGCADYDETPGDAFAQSTTATMTLGAVSGSRTTASAPRLEISSEGDYSVVLPAPLMHGRLIVLQDVFDSPYFLICKGGNERTPEASQIAWLRGQLSAARDHGEQVWVMGHIPPGVDVYASFHRYFLRPGELCSAPPHPFLQDSALSDTLLDYAATIRLALFAHTHMDEIRLIHRDREAPGGRLDAVPIKLVPSVTPYFGNHPAFMVAAIDPHTMVLKDWRTFVSPSTDGSAAPWPVAYQFSTAYGLPDLSAASATTLIDGFNADRSGRDPRSGTYRGHFFAGDLGLYALGLGQIWPAYACAAREDRLDNFHDCLCPAPTKTGSH